MVRTGREPVDMGPCPGVVRRGQSSGHGLAVGMIASVQEPTRAEQRRIVNREAQRASRARRPHVPAVRRVVACTVCGEPCEQGKGEPRLYCGRRCQGRAYRARRDAA